MKLTKTTVGPLMAAVATIVATVAPAFAADTTVIETITTKKVTLQGSVVTTPMISVEGLQGKAVVAQSPFPQLYVKYTASNGITIFYIGARDDLNMRRDDLLARIMIERADGVISADVSNDFIGRLERIDGMRASTPTDSFSRAYFQHVGDVYRGYDHLAQDLQTSSGLGNKQLAGRYTYFVY
jgi:hypothetical protein